MDVKRYKIIKRMQELYAWAEFYAKNEQHEQSYTIQNQIKNYKEKHNL